MPRSERVGLEEGAGGEATRRLLQDIIEPILGNQLLSAYNDSAVFTVPGSQLAFTTDSFTVWPLFFPGGDIGRLAVAGTCNDLAMAAARPCYLSLSLIIEAGFLLSDLKSIIQSVARELVCNEALVVTGDTKVIEKTGKQPGLLINTSGIGLVEGRAVSPLNIKNGDILVLSGPPGIHEAVIFTSREELELQSNLESDLRSLWPAVRQLLLEGLELRALRDVTRGGIAGVCNEWASDAQKELVIDASSVPMRPEVLGLCELTGFDVWQMAGEGCFLLALPEDQAQKALNSLRSSGFHQATLIGKVIDGSARVLLEEKSGSRRILYPPRGIQLPRIC